jgi:2-polyprenyl-3-methyl-5-hydroxy-6-metoxy-1,4-benzoquinol methylase
MNVERLSSKEHWDSVLSGALLPRIHTARIYNYYVVMKFVDEILRREKKKTFLEIGCGSSGWLPYFARTYGFTVSGIDYSDIGCRLAEENLRMQGIPFDEIICQDLFEWRSEKKYDVIFSYGVVEHFEQPERVIKICYDHLETGGLIVTLVPNLQGLMGFLGRWVVPEVYKMHKVISRESLRASHCACGFTEIKSGYAGTFSLAVVPWSRSGSRLLREGSPARRFSLKLISLLDRGLTVLLKTLRLEVPSRFASPYVISVMRKETHE